MNNPCPVCNYDLNQPETQHGDHTFFSCPRCGDYKLSGTAKTILPQKFNEAGRIGKDEEKYSRALLSHVLRKLQTSTPQPLLTDALVQKILSDNSLPAPKEQADNLIVALGNRFQKFPAAQLDLENTKDALELTAIIGAVDKEGIDYIIDSLLKNKWIVDKAPPFQNLSRGLAGKYHLTLAGWQIYDELLNKIVKSRKAFMAMAFGNQDLTKIVDSHFRPAVQKTGFDLVRLDDRTEQQAGSIDNRLRITLRTARFVIADLTDDNSGAYWEAGFAEGLGRPVIYTCEQIVLDSKKVHFDTRNQLIIPWDKNNPQEAVEKLKDTIRATLPEESILEDPPA